MEDTITQSLYIFNADKVRKRCSTELITVRGGHLKDMSWIWPVKGSSIPLTQSLECMFCPLFPQWKPFLRTRP